MKSMWLIQVNITDWIYKWNQNTLSKTWQGMFAWHNSVFVAFDLVLMTKICCIQLYICTPQNTHVRVILRWARFLINMPLKEHMFYNMVAISPGPLHSKHACNLHFAIEIIRAFENGCILATCGVMVISYYKTKIMRRYYNYKSPYWYQDNGIVR